MNKYLWEDGEGGPANATQVGNVASGRSGKIDTFGHKKRINNNDDFYSMLLELDDCTNDDKLTESKSQYSGNAITLATNFIEYANEPNFFSETERTLYSNLAKIIKDRYKDDDSITILKTQTGYEIILNVEL